MSGAQNFTFKRYVANKLTANFREATVIETVEFSSSSLKRDEILVKNFYAGINASDVNFVAGRYDPSAKPPLYPGFEALGKVVALGPSVKRLKIGDSVAITGYGCFSEYIVIGEKKVVPIPLLVPEILPILVGGLTASLALEFVGEMKSKQTVLVTAAAGGTGHFAVQLAKIAGNHVIGTCSSNEKIEFLKKMGCDRVINYKEENLNAVLKKEYPKGVDVVYESVGGDTFDACVNNLAVKGKIIIIGFVSGYQDQSGWVDSKKKAGTPLTAKLLAKSASVRGFFLNHYAEHFKSHMEMLTNLIKEGKLISQVDSQKFVGLESVPLAIDHLYQGKNVGKVVVNLSSPSSKL